jgi:membrane-associated PAP2 superfamily phosphatase
MDPDRSNPASGAQFVQHGYSPSAPGGLVGRTGVSGAASLGLGIIALLLAIWSVLPLLAWLTALGSVACGFLVLLPRATSATKVMTGIGVVAALVAIGLLVS